MNAVQLSQVSALVAELRWASNTSNDMIADSALALLLGIDSSPATVKCEHHRFTHLTIVTSNPHPHSHSHGHGHGHSHSEKTTEDSFVSADDLERLRLFLKAHFGQVDKPSKDEDESDLLALDIKVDDLKARLDLISMVSRLSPGRN